MLSIDRLRLSLRLEFVLLGAAVCVVAACSGPSGEAPGDTRGSSGPKTIAPAAPAPLPVVPPTAGTGRSHAALPAPSAVRSWVEVRRQAAQRIVAANPDITYMGKVPEPLLAIPVLEIELNADGSIRHIEVLRPPRQAKDTVRIAAEAVRRAGPFGNVSKLPKPWKSVETFLFDDSRKFKPRTLDE